MTDVVVGVRRAGRSDIDFIVAVHQRAFPDFYMTRMGPAFLRTYYRTVLACEGGQLFVAEADGRCLGFVAGSLDPARFYAFMSQRKALFIWPAFLGIIRRPTLIGRTLFNRSRVRLASRAREVDANTAELSSIGVDPLAASRGVGGDLLQAFTESALAGGSDCISLTTDARDNQRVNSFYLKHGFSLVTQFVSASDREMNEYRKRLK